MVVIADGSPLAIARFAVGAVSSALDSPAGTWRRSDSGRQVDRAVRKKQPPTEFFCDTRTPGRQK